MSDGGEQDEAQKTEEPTQKKLDDSRKKGDVALSREVNNWLMLLAGTILVMSLSSRLMSDLRAFLTKFIAEAHTLPASVGGFGDMFSSIFFEVISIIALPFLVLLVAAAAGPLMQVGPMFSPESIKPKLNKISPLSGFKRLFSMKSLVEFLKGILKIGMVGVVGFFLLYPFYGAVDHLVGMPLIQVLYEMKSLVLRFLAGALIVILVVAVTDLVYQRNAHHKKMRMTQQEVKDEYRQSEGDPHVKGKLKQLRSERSRQRMMQSVPEADVVITNPTHFAIALKYQPEEMDAPMCVAKGQDQVALKIREVAEENDVIIYEDKPLARTLYGMVEIDQTIPADQYQAVAKIISYVFKKKGRL